MMSNVPSPITARESRVAPLACRMLASSEECGSGEYALATATYGVGERRLIEDAPEAGLTLEIPLPTLGEPLHEVWTSPQRPRLRREGPLRLATTDDLLFGAIEVEEEDLERDVGRLYDRVLDTLAGSAHRHVLRMWNVIPRITERAAGSRLGLDRYMLFCRARSFAFERHMGSEFARLLGAASAVGGTENRIVVSFLASSRPGERISNPRQEEPWLYPPRYGPRSPSFARALEAPFPGTRFLSGTASIVGHASLHANDIGAQVDETLRNLRLIAPREGGDRQEWVLKAFVRKAEDLEAVRTRVAAAFGARTPVLYLRADMCRPELDIEIEGVVRRPA